ncbi:MAG: monofunctional biosynthetic peptidoglycan transglycosylase [Pseudomonadota bacterium]
MSRARPSPLRRLFRWVLRLAASFLLFSVALTIVYSVVPPPATVLMIQGLLRGDGLAKDWEPIEAISPHLIRSVIAAEDARFCEHSGFDWEAIAKAWRSIERGSSRLRGGSTISNQTAKNVFLWPARNWIRKGLEAYFTVLIELIWGKQRIMEVYLNVIEFGPGVYGAEAASQRFFGKSAADLTRREAALLAAVLPDPEHWSAANPGPYVRSRTATIMVRANDAPDAGAAVCPPGSGHF